MDQNILNDINKFGWSIILIEATDYLPSFACTIGLWKNYQHPELISFGLPVSSLQHILNIAAETVKEGKTIVPGRAYDDFFENGTAEFVKVDTNNLGDYFGYVIDFYKTDIFPALQLVWPDRNNLLPWESGFEEEFKYKQPLLDRNAAFKFSEEKDLIVNCSRQFQENKQPILHVLHQQDGTWDFLSAGADEHDTISVSLGKMVQTDPTLNNLFNLDYGEQALRTTGDGKWVRALIEPK